MRAAFIALLGGSFVVNSVAAFVSPTVFTPRSVLKSKSSATSLSTKKSEGDSLVTLINDMTETSMLMYTYADLRDLARDGKIDDDILKIPITATEVSEICEQDKEVIKEELGQDSLDRCETITKMAARQKKAGRQGKATISAFSDEFKEKSLVFAVVVDDAKKRVTVAFRGTNSLTDMLVDVSAWLQKMPNRMKRYDEDQPDTLRVHDGFHDYLFDPIPEKYYSTVYEDDLLFGEERSKFDVIMQRFVLPVLKEKKDYELNVTGHSLGAALATLFAFRAATIENEYIHKPVTCVSVASPFVGSKNYREAFQLAEKKNLIKHLRVSGEGDLITTLPFVSINLAASVVKGDLAPGKPFKHVGMNLKLSKLTDSDKMSYKIMYPTESNSAERVWESSIIQNLVAPWDLLDNHMNYDDRIDALENDEYLNSVTLEDLYADSSLFE